MYLTRLILTNLFAEKLSLKVIKHLKSSKFIELKIGTVHIRNKKTENDEAYNLKVNPQNKIIQIVGNTRKGVFWGVQSLLSMMDNGEIPWVTVEDSPRYEYRGLSIDVARNFLPKAEVMRILDGIAMFKMNKLHLHLTDDEGWRLEIPGLPELTEVGPLGAGAGEGGKGEGGSGKGRRDGKGSIAGRHQTFIQ